MKYSRCTNFGELVKRSFLDGNDPDLELLDSIDDSEVVLSERFYERKKAVLDAYKGISRARSFKRTMISIAVAALIVISIVCVTVACVSTLRNAVWNAIVEWYEDYITVKYEPPKAESESDIETVTQAPPPTKIETVRKPTYLPDGVEERVVLQSSAMLLSDYFINDEWVFGYRQSILTNNDKYIGESSAVIKTVYINGGQAYIVSSDNVMENNDYTLIWNDEIYMYRIYYSNKISEREITRIAESIE